MAVPLPRLGVVVLNWNGRDLLDDCIASVLASDHPDFVLVVVDNASTDGSVEHLRDRWPQVDLVCNDTNLRFAEGNNRGCERLLELGADVVVLLNNDATVSADALRHLAKALDDAPRLGIAGPRICFERPANVIWYGGGIFHRWWGVVRHRAIRRPADDRHDPAGATDWVTGCCLAVRSTVWKSLRGLDPSFYIYSEDVDFCLRAHAAGWGARYVPAARVDHAVSSTVGGAWAPFKTYHQSRARRQLLLRHAKPWHWPTLVVGLVGQELATLGWLVARGHGGAARALIHSWLDSLTGSNRYLV